MPYPHASVKFKMRAEIAGHVFRDIVQFACSFEMNSIPEASLLVSVGREVTTQAVATIHRAVNDMRVHVPAKIFLEARVEEHELINPVGVEWFDTQEGRLLFEGYAVGTGWRRSHDSAQFQIHLVHWLSDLHYASAISASSHPGNPGDWKYPAAFAAVGLADAASAGGQSPGEPTWVPMINDGVVTDSDVREDLWGNVLHKWMKHVSQDDPFEFRLQGGQLNAADNPRIQSTLAALERLAPNSDGVPLAVDMAQADGQTIADALRLALVNESGASWLNTTLWGKLIGEWSPAYWFTLIPRIEDGLIVPFTGGLQGEPHAVIEASDYNSCDANAQLHQVLRAVGIVHPILWQTGANGMNSSIIGDRTGCCGWYQPPGVTKGMVLTKDAPKWLCDPDILHRYTLASTGFAASEAIETGLDADGTGSERKPDKDPADIQAKNKSIMDNYAHQWYVIEMLKGRIGELSGKLRFDISPGSNVLIKSGAAVNLAPEDDALVEDIYATVSRVSYVINAEAGKAATSFSLAHIRTSGENQDAATSVAKPPLYQTTWRGAALVPGSPIEK